MAVVAIRDLLDLPPLFLREDKPTPRSCWSIVYSLLVNQVTYHGVVVFAMTRFFLRSLGELFEFGDVKEPHFLHEAI